MNHESAMNDSGEQLGLHPVLSGPLSGAWREETRGRLLSFLTS